MEVYVDTLNGNGPNTNKSKKPSLLKVVWSPIEQMHNIKNNPNIILPLFLVTLLYTIGAATLALNYDIDGILAEIPDSENNRLLFKSIVVGTAALSGLTTPLFNILITSVFIYIVAKFAKSSVTFRQIFSLNTYVMIIGVMGLLLNTLIVHLFNIEGIQTMTSITSLINDTSFNKIEIFTIWQTILTGIGIYHIADFSKKLSWIITIILMGAILLSGFLFPAGT